MLKNKRDISALLIVLVAGLAFSAPLLMWGFTKLADDSLIHATWTQNYLVQWRQGEWYPRWLSAMNNGLGSPVFFFYAPVPYWTTALTSLTFLHAPSPWEALGRTMTVALMLSGLFAYMWLRTLVGRRVAVVSSLLYMILPYHLAIDLYARSAISEFWSFAWLPLILYCATLIARGTPSGKIGLPVVGLAVGYALLAMTHLPTLVIFTPVIIAFLAWGDVDGIGVDGSRRARMGKYVAGIGGLALGMGLASSYLIPAFLLKKFAALDELGQSINTYDKFFYDPRGMDTPRDFFYSTVLTLATACAAYWFAQKRANDATADTATASDATASDATASDATASDGGEQSRATRSRAARFWLATALLSTFMMFPPSIIIWKLLPILQIIQFPWRFNVLLTVACAALFALGIANLKTLNVSARRLFWAGSVVTLAGTALLTAERVRQDYFMAPRPALAEAIIVNLRDNVDATEYRPRWAFLPPKTDKKIPNTQDTAHKQPLGVFVGNGGKAEVLSHRPREITFAVQLKQAGKLRVRQLYFPGWHAELLGDGAGAPAEGVPGAGTTGGQRRLTIEPSQPDGWIIVSVPEGSYQLRLRLEPTSAELLGVMVSQATLLLLAGICVLSLFLPRTKRLA